MEFHKPELLVVVFEVGGPLAVEAALLTFCHAHLLGHRQNQIALAEKREREAQEEKERAEARREDSRVKGSSSQKRSGQQKAKGGSPGWADDL